MSPKKSQDQIIAEIIEIIISAPAVTMKEISEKTGLSYPTIHRNLELIESIQKSPKILRRKSGQNNLYYCEK